MNSKSVVFRLNVISIDQKLESHYNSKISYVVANVVSLYL